MWSIIIVLVLLVYFSFWRTWFVSVQIKNDCGEDVKFVRNRDGGEILSVDAKSEPRSFFLPKDELVLVMIRGKVVHKFYYEKELQGMTMIIGLDGDTRAPYVMTMGMV